VCVCMYVDDVGGLKYVCTMKAYWPFTDMSSVYA
jgi:hypothetical protein